MNMLKNLKSKDTAKINVLIYIICEMYLELENKKKNLFQNINYAFPYEILAWLKLRELKGLKNPTKFTHPLMNTPIAKMFLNIKEPLPKPKELPYAKELLEKLKEKCPDVEIPQWLDSEDTPNTEKETQTQSNDTIPDDFMK